MSLFTIALITFAWAVSMCSVGKFYCVSVETAREKFSSEQMGKLENVCFPIAAVSCSAVR